MRGARRGARGTGYGCLLWTTSRPEHVRGGDFLAISEPCARVCSHSCACACSVHAVCTARGMCDGYMDLCGASRCLACVTAHPDALIPKPPPAGEGSSGLWPGILSRRRKEGAEAGTDPSSPKAGVLGRPLALLSTLRGTQVGTLRQGRPVGSTGPPPLPLATGLTTPRVDTGHTGTHRTRALPGEDGPSALIGTAARSWPSEAQALSALSKACTRVLQPPAQHCPGRQGQRRGAGEAPCPCLPSG